MANKNNVLIIVDMVNGFVNFGALADKKIDKITPNIIKLIDKSIEKDYPIIAFRDAHSLDDEEFNVFPIHCLKGEPESDLIPQLVPYRDNFYEIEKNTTNGFITPEFEDIVKRISFDNVYVVGCCTDICVLNFVNSFLAFNKKYSRDTKIKVFEDACATFDGANHDAQEMHAKAIREMQNNGAIIISLNEKIKE